ncbi:hypothetical protein QO002_001606 [Pararhizobium capsulatum DSM 1112]|uniref:SnoaL-like domain-containing protein n=1 Tax=Pararhizobium capsulatum DSM 1112 TaxID=1121113 RepID=A0ABU0BMI7_9HYPH|nr:nuclear transport factor 2 family protein [Pararhizobium capsulatum]MDQ0319468.1 hypothetical protein [Pararhizobium capsulatum DSM 1112]
MTIDPCALAARFHHAINELDFATIENFFVKDAHYSSGKVGGLAGRDAIMAAFRRYFDEYPDQVAEDSLIEQVSPFAARAVWSLKATSASTGAPFSRRGEETITFNPEGKVINVEVTDYDALA